MAGDTPDQKEEGTPLQLPTIITTSSSLSSRPSTPPPSQPAASSAITPSTPTQQTPPPTFSIYDADSPKERSSPASLLPVPSEHSPTTNRTRTPSPNLGGYSTSEGGPPSPTGSGQPFLTSLTLRDNEDSDEKRIARENEVQNLGVAYPASSFTYSDAGHSSAGGHQRRPSAAFSVASTVPDGASDNRPLTGGKKVVQDIEKGAAGDMGAAEREGDLKGDEEPQGKILGFIPRRKKKEVAPVVRPDPTEAEMAPFDSHLTPSALYTLIDPKSKEHLASLGGTEGILAGLRTDGKKGLSDAGGEIPLSERVRVFGENRTPSRPTKSLLMLMWMAYQDKVLLILSVAAVVSLALGLYQDLGTPPTTFKSTRCANDTCTEPQVDWVEGVAITIAIFIVVIVGSVNDWQKERQFQKLNAQKEERNVKAVRNGVERLMSVYDVVVGDILHLEPGEIVPVDGVFLQGHNVKCDESGATGESDAVRKLTYDEWQAGGKGDCFLLSGSKVLEGVGTYVVTAVGESSFHGKLMMALRGDAEETPLQLKLNALAELIAKLGSLAGLILFGALMIRFFVELGTNPGRTPQVKAQNFINILIIAVTIVVVAVPEGLPLAVTLALAFATRRMTKQNLLVRVLGACETMANATVICTDKTGTLTQNKMSVVAGSIGVHLKFADRLAENASRTNANDDIDDENAAQAPPRKGRLDFSSEMTEIGRHITPALAKLLNESIAINSTAFEGTDEHGTVGGFVGSKTETALLAFAKTQGWANYQTTRDSAEIVQMLPFSSERKSMGVVVRLPNGTYRLYIKGASEVLAKLSSRHVVVTEDAGNGSEDEAVPTQDFTEETRSNINRTIIWYANQSLRTIALCTRDLPRWPPIGAETNTDGEVPFEDLSRDLTLVAITAIEDPLRDGVAQAVATCQKAGVMVKMCTGDNVLTARSIATQCGIFTAGGVIMEGPVFRKLSVADRDQVVPRLQILARSSPEDKKILVEHLKGMGEVVGVTGDGANDGPALKTANVGFSMGIAGTEIAKEASDIILMDDNFSSIVAAIMWGRCVNDSVAKFLQFQLSVNITAVIITFVTAVASSDETSVLTAVQLLWVNLIMDTFAALALATDPADPESLDRKPNRKTAPLVTPEMWMHIIGQAIYQIIVSLVLHFAGSRIFNFNATDEGVRLDQANELNTVVFNSFVFCQIFNQLNARRLDRGFNVFRGIMKNWYFMAIFAIMVGGQIIIVFFGGAAFQVTPLKGRDWAVCIVLGLLSLPLGALIRTIPPAPFARFMIKYHLYPDPNAPLPTTAPAAEDRQWNEGIEKVIDNLNTFSRIRGGRTRASSIVRKSRTKQMEEAGIHTSALMAMVPSLIMSSVGAPLFQGSLSDPASADPSKSSMQLVAHGAQVHPDTDKDDALAQKFGMHRIRTPGHSRNPSSASAQSGHSRGSSLTVPRGVDSLSAVPRSVVAGPLRSPLTYFSSS